MPRPDPDHLRPTRQGIQKSIANPQDRDDAVPDATYHNHVSFSSYPYIELRGLSALKQEDLAFLNSKGCLQIPAPPLLEEFVRQYFLHVQPCTPIIDESAFWNLYRQESFDSSAPKLSLLLVQAFLFTSSPYIDLQTAQTCGFENKREAWNALYERAKVCLPPFVPDT